MTMPSGVFGGFLVHDSFVLARVERLANRFDGDHALRCKERPQLALDKPHALDPPRLLEVFRHRPARGRNRRRRRAACGAATRWLAQRRPRAAARSAAGSSENPPHRVATQRAARWLPASRLELSVERLDYVGRFSATGTCSAAASTASGSWLAPESPLGRGEPDTWIRAGRRRCDVVRS